MTWTYEGHKMNSNAGSAERIEHLNTKDVTKMVEKIFGEIDKESINIMKIRIRRLVKDGWLKELPDRYVMTEKARKRREMLRERVKKGVMS